ncbi:MAG: D-aminoacylase [Acidimicrobiales bacterium]
MVADGTGSPLRRADVAVKDGTILAIVEPSDEVIASDAMVAGSGRVIDATGHIVAPGFIDTHTHDDFAVIIYPEMRFKVLGGVTTCIVGNCGLGAAPFEPASTMAASFHPNAELSRWDGYAGFLDTVEAAQPSVNVAALMGHGTIRLGAMGAAKRPCSEAELQAMTAAVEEGLAAGCIGLSTGLIYVPGTFAETDELVALSEVVGRAGGIYTSHIRNEGDGLLTAVAEAIDVGRRASLPVVISHLKATGEENWGRVSEAIELIESARAEGLTVNADQYPYTAGSTSLGALVSQGAFRSDKGGLGLLPPESVVLASSATNPEWIGQNMAQLAELLGCDPADAADVVCAADPRSTCILHRMSEADVQTVLATPGIMIGSDGLPTMEGKPHPRLYATFARVLGHYSRELGLLPVEEAVHRMTGKPAEVFGLVDRGRIAVGAHADITVFDPNAIIDTATYDDPHQHHPASRP